MVLLKDPEGDTGGLKSGPGDTERTAPEGDGDTEGTIFAGDGGSGNVPPGGGGGGGGPPPVLPSLPRDIFLAKPPKDGVEGFAPAVKSCVDSSEGGSGGWGGTSGIFLISCVDSTDGGSGGRGISGIFCPDSIVDSPDGGSGGLGSTGGNFFPTSSTVTDIPDALLADMTDGEGGASSGTGGILTPMIEDDESRSRG